MIFDLDLTIALLERTPATLAAWLGDLPDAWIHAREAPKTFSPYDVVGHLIHGEKTDWIPRAKIVLELGQSKPFTPYDRFAQEQASAGRPLGELLREFDQRRRENLATLRAWNLGPEQLTLRGTHRELGTVTLSELIATWAAHDLTHLHQISRVLAHQYRREVGPWARYLGVLRCDGHSD